MAKGQRKTVINTTMLMPLKKFGAGKDSINDRILQIYKKKKLNRKINSHFIMQYQKKSPRN